MRQVRSRQSLEGGDYGWLKAKHHFSVTPAGNQAHSPIGALVVWNDDEIAPRTGFGLHSHSDMEIISYVREGAVTHRDSEGNVGHTLAGDVQVMSAGTGIQHAEHNDTDGPLRLFQIWIRPRQRGGAPRWDTRRFPKMERSGQFVVLASGLPGDSDALPIRADARVLGASLRAGTALTYELGGLPFAYLTAAQGALEVNRERLDQGDGLALVNEQQITIKAESDAELILVATF